MAKPILWTYLAMALALARPTSAQQRFDSPDAAARAVIDAAGSHDDARLAAIFGPQGGAVLSSGNYAQDRTEQSEFRRLADSKYQLIVDPRNANRVILSIGEADWPFPVPIVHANGKWAFDATETKGEMQARRVGVYELDAIEICAGYVEAQRQYAAEDADKNGGFQYAPRMLSGAQGSGLRMAQGLVDAAWDGQKKLLTPYHGYFFRILDGQGPHARGGAHDYRVGNKQMGGFGLVAWPARFGVTGVLTFMVNQDGEIYQKEIAPRSDAAAAPITRYDPDPAWKPVN